MAVVKTCTETLYVLDAAPLVIKHHNELETGGVSLITPGSGPNGFRIWMTEDAARELATAIRLELEANGT